MADYNSSHVGNDIDTSVNKILTVNGDGGLVSKNFLSSTLEDYIKHIGGTISAISSTTPVITHEPISISYIAGVKGNGAGVYCKKDLNASQWYPMVATDTYAGGGWAIGTYTSEALQFVYGTKANKDSNVNTTSILNLNAGNGTITTSVSSSIKIKENIHEFSIEEAKKLLQIRTVTFDYKQGYGEKNQYGFIAEEVDNIIPYVVYKPTDNIQKDKNEYWSIEYHKFIPWIVKLLQIQQQEINELRQKINS